MKEKLKSAIKGNVFIVWLRILFDKIGESFSLTLYSGSTNQTKDIFKKAGGITNQNTCFGKGNVYWSCKSRVWKRKGILYY